MKKAKNEAANSTPAQPPRMSTKGVIEGAIKKALDNGWTSGSIVGGRAEPLGGISGTVTVKLLSSSGDEFTSIVEALIFDISFAQHLFGAEKIKVEVVPNHTVAFYVEPAWKYHIKNLAASKDRILYLQRHALEDV